ncbi:MAG: hypothetical protein ACHQ4H_03365 [Ktedonobacterales bacterium]|jgi:hypothetical protein
MTLTFIIIAAILSLPIGLGVAAAVSMARARWLAIPAGIAGDVVVAIAIYYFVTTTKIPIDGLDYFIGALFACSAGVVGAALLANFLVGLASRRPEVTSAEF